MNTVTDEEPMTYQDDTNAKKLAEAVLAFETYPTIWARPTQQCIYLVTRCDANGNVYPFWAFETKEVAEYYAQKVFGRDWAQRIRLVMFVPGGQPDTPEKAAEVQAEIERPKALAKASRQKPRKKTKRKAKKK